MGTPFRKDVLLPTGRFLNGDLYTPNEKDDAGNLRVVKSGPNAGKPAPQFFVQVAIAKTPGVQHWAHEKFTLPNGTVVNWGAEIWTIGNSCFPGVAEKNPAFAWKIIDGDSDKPNTKGVIPRTRENWPGNWILSLASMIAPKIVNENGSAYLLEKDHVKRGYYVQVLVSCDGNESIQKPGIYLNPSVVSFQAPGPVIYSGPDPASVGFGGGPRPAGAMAMPAAGLPGPVAVSLPVALPGALPAVSAPVAAPIVLSPSPGFLAPPPAAIAPPPGPRWLEAGTTHAQYTAAGWTDAQLLQAGKMVA
jgi:hypothetical protein